MRTYAWGSRTAIADFTGAPNPSAHPEAELWFGAHPADPAWLQTDVGEQSLLEALRADPEGELGPAVRGRFGDTLPFLVRSRRRRAAVAAGAPEHRAGDRGIRP